MKYHTKIACGGLPPFHMKCVAGRVPGANGSAPCRTTRNASIIANPAYMSTNCTWSVNTTVRSPPLSM